MTVLKNRGKVIRFVSKTLLLVIPDKIWKFLIHACKRYFTQWDAKRSRRLCSLFGVAGYNNEVMPREWIYPLKKRLFGQYKFLVPGDAEHYLRRLYGKWQELPPKEKRVPARDGYLYFKEVSQ